MLLDRGFSRHHCLIGKIIIFYEDEIRSIYCNGSGFISFFASAFHCERHQRKNYSYLCSINPIRSIHVLQRYYRSGRYKKTTYTIGANGRRPACTTLHGTGGCRRFSSCIGVCTLLELHGPDRHGFLRPLPVVPEVQRTGASGPPLVFPIISKKDKKKEVCDDYLTEWRGFRKTALISI